MKKIKIMREGNIKDLKRAKLLHIHSSFHSFKMAEVLAKICQSSVLAILLTLFSVFTYVQDIFEDILVIASSLSSDEVYRVLFNLKMAEKAFGFVMISMFGLSIVVIGWDTISRANQLTLIKNHRWLHVICGCACLLNLGPVFFIFLKLVLSFDRAEKMYKTWNELNLDRQKIDAALSSTKMKEAMCENLPMLILMSFKTALSSHVSLLEIISTSSSACLLANAFISFISHQRTAPLGVLKKVFGSFLLGSFICVTLLIVTIFAIEAERDGILVSSDPTQGSEDSSGLVLIFLIFPSIFFCLIPFSIYDLIPFFFKGSPVIWEYFQDPPQKFWYLSMVFCTMGLGFNLMSASYLYKRDLINLMDSLPPFFSGRGCQDDVLGLSLPSILCEQYDLKIGAGRIYFKIFLVFAMIVTNVMYLCSVMYILGMRYRERGVFRDGFYTVLTNQLQYQKKNFYGKVSSETFAAEGSFFLKKQGSIFHGLNEGNPGKWIERAMVFAYLFIYQVLIIVY